MDSIRDCSLFSLDYDIAVEMSDGGSIHANLFRPETPDKVPAIVTLGPYGKDPMWEAAFPHFWRPAVSDVPTIKTLSSCRYIRYEAPDPERWLSFGYALIHADSRGAGKSPGFLVD